MPIHFIAGPLTVSCTLSHFPVCRLLCVPEACASQWTQIACLLYWCFQGRPGTLWGHTLVWDFLLFWRLQHAQCPVVEAEDIISVHAGLLWLL